MEGETVLKAQGNGAHILIIPFPAGAHIFPHLDLTHQLLLRGLTASVVVTPKMLHYLNPILSLHDSSNIQPLVLPFPSQSPIPVGVEDMENVPISFLPHIVTAFSKLLDPLVEWFKSHPFPPVAIVTDPFFCCWANKLASHLNIPNIGFSAVNANTMSSWFVNGKDPATSMPGELFIACMQSWGIIFNSFSELDGEKMKVISEDFTKHDRLWAVGPLPRIKARNMTFTEKDQKPSSIPQDQVIAWLDSCDVDKSVVYVGFGTQIYLNNEQMEAVASALEKSGVRFIWTVKNPPNAENDHNVVPTGFEDRVAGRGLVIKGWAPQVAILGHRAVGSYLTHCGWNSTMEGILGGVLLLMWPMQADHFNNAKLLVDEQGAAIKVCEGLKSVPDATKLAQILADSVNTVRPERIQGLKLRQFALDAVKEGGSSHKALDVLVQRLSSLSISK
ncbi:UDP-glycosyltransferase 89C1, putative [Theobroma cacao]|uniref:UDP-glycosyltransferase 89C1, putative n=1 Tax=Theobroma cacao TaxID=3641 RepID=A0A061EJ20_THECC|nr:UDP-glycosyltransferase 89C1, putative [Theobroma cacao]